jgi:hypothetical protein
MKERKMGQDGRFLLYERERDSLFEYRVYYRIGEKFKGSLCEEAGALEKGTGIGVG